jgi:hypothetical protein
LLNPVWNTTGGIHENKLHCHLSLTWSRKKISEYWNLILIHYFSKIVFTRATWLIQDMLWLAWNNLLSYQAKDKHNLNLVFLIGVQLGHEQGQVNPYLKLPKRVKTACNIKYKWVWRLPIGTKSKYKWVWRLPLETKCKRFRSRHSLQV